MLAYICISCKHALISVLGIKIRSTSHLYPFAFTFPMHPYPANHRCLRPNTDIHLRIIIVCTLISSQLHLVYRRVWPVKLLRKATFEPEISPTFFTVRVSQKTLTARPSAVGVGLRCQRARPGRVVRMCMHHLRMCSSRRRTRQSCHYE